MVNDRNKLGAAIRIGLSPTWSFYLTLNLGSRSYAAINTLIRADYKKAQCDKSGHSKETIIGLWNFHVREKEIYRYAIFLTMYKKEPGFIKAIVIKGVPVYLHWSFPIGGLLIAGFFNSSPEKIIFFVSAYLLLVLIHEIGHLLFARFFGLKVHAITVTGGGGRCFCDKPESYREALYLYGGGILAQLALFILTSLYVYLFGYPSSSVGNAFVLTFTVFNLFMILINIIPSKLVGGNVNDGHVLWMLLKELLFGIQIMASDLKLIDYGIYDFENPDEPKLVKLTDKFRASINTSFGIEVEIFGHPVGELIQIKHIVIYPENGIKNFETGTVKHSDYVYVDVPIGEKIYRGYKFTSDYEIVPGEWVHQIIIDDQLHVEKTFNVMI